MAFWPIEVMVDDKGRKVVSLLTLLRFGILLRSRCEFVNLMPRYLTRQAFRCSGKGLSGAGDFKALSSFYISLSPSAALPDCHNHLCYLQLKYSQVSKKRNSQNLVIMAISTSFQVSLLLFDGSRVAKQSLTLLYYVRRSLQFQWNATHV